MYFGEMALSLADKLGLHPSILACLRKNSSSNLPKWVPLGPMDGNEDTSLS
jgi:hypothetical protein